MKPKLNLKRKLAEGTAGWLLYEFHCMRGDLFSEKHLATPIGNILAGCYGQRVRAEVTHPILSQPVPGRPPQMDFAVFENGKISIAVESKWAGKGTVSTSDILWDLIRLELLAFNYGATCYFVLAGRKTILEQMFASDSFNQIEGNSKTRPILRTAKKPKRPGLHLDSPPAATIPLLKKRFASYPHLSVPSRIITGWPSFYPTDPVNLTFQTFVWRISSKAKRETFLPSQHRFYQAGTV